MQGGCIVVRWKKLHQEEGLFVSVCGDRDTRAQGPDKKEDIPKSIDNVEK